MVSVRKATRLCTAR